MTLETVRKKPLFFAALAFSSLIVIQAQFPSKLPEHEISFRIEKNGASVFLRGVIVSEIEERDTYYGDHLLNFVLSAEAISKGEQGAFSPMSGKARVYLRNPATELNYGDEVLVKGDLRAPKGVRNPGGFDQKSYLENKGIRALFYGDRRFEAQVLKRHQGNFFRERAIASKQFLSKKLSEAFEKRDAAFLKALFLGERTGLDNDFKDLFIKTGTMHILSVSGFNIGFLSLAIFFLLKPFSLPKDLKLWLTLVMIWAYCLLVGWQSPVVRASVMATVLIAARLLGRKPNLLNSLGLAALIILAVNPKQLFDIGFQLSFIAVFAIAQVLPLFSKRPELWPNEKWTFREKTAHYLTELFWVSFVCLVATLPVTLQSFYIVTPLSLAANMVVVPLSFALFFAGIVFFLTFWWLPSWLSFIPIFVKLMMKGFIASLWVIENLPGAYFTIGKLELFLWWPLVAGIVFFLQDKQIKNRWVRAAAIVLFISNILLFQVFFRDLHREFRMTVLDVGQGDAIYFEFPDGGNLLMDAGKGGEGDSGRWVIVPFLKSKGVSRIDALAASHPQEDHIGGMAAVLDEFKVRHFIDAGNNYPTKTFALLQEKIKREKAAHLLMKRGRTLEGFKGINIAALNPADASPNNGANDASLVLKIQYKGSSFLLTGDIEERTMADMIDSGIRLKADVLKVPHHGARLKDQGQRFVREVSPSVSVISAGERNPFHHPSEETLRTLSSIPGNRVYRTDTDRAVEIVSDGKNLMVKFLHADQAS